MPKKGTACSEATKRLLRRAQTHYKSTYIGEILEYFSSPKTKTGWRREIDIAGVVQGQVIEGKFPVYIPTLTGFCEHIGCSLPTLYRWVDEYPEFADAYEEAMEIKRELIYTYAAAGAINPNFAKYMLESWKPRQRKAPTIEEEKKESSGGNDGVHINVTINSVPDIMEDMAPAEEQKHEP